MTTREPYQIRVHLIEVRGLKGSVGESDLVNPVIKVSVDAGAVKKSQRSSIYKDVRAPARHPRRAARLAAAPPARPRAKATPAAHHAAPPQVSSVFFDEHKVFSVDMARDEFTEGKVIVQVEDDQGLFTNKVIGEVTFDLFTVHESLSHEKFNIWVAVLSADKADEIQGFLRVSVVVLKSGEVPKTHTKAELEDDGGDDGGSMVVGLPEINLEAFQLSVLVYRVELSETGLARPDTYVRMRFAGTKPVRSGVFKNSYKPNFQDELKLPIYLPNNSDRVIIEIVNKKDDDEVLADMVIGLRSLRAEDMEPQWVNMYGPRPTPPSLQALAADALQFTNESRHRLTTADPNELPPKPVEVNSSWRARMLLYATIEASPKQKPKNQRLPKILSKAQLEDIEPEVIEFTLRCDLFEGIGFPLGPFDKIFLVLEWGPTERKSKLCSPDDGKVTFDSPQPSKQGYYELLDEITHQVPVIPEHQYDIFLHCYVATPTGNRRLGFKKWGARQLLEKADGSGWKTMPQWITFMSDDAEDISMHTAMVQVALRYAERKEIVKAQPRRDHVRIPKMMRYELAANIYQGKDMQPADENGLADPYVKVSLAGVERETAIIERTLQPIWYERINIPLDLPRNLDLAPKIVMLVYDSDPVLGVTVPGRGLDPVIGIAICPPDHDTTVRSIKEYYVRTGSSTAPRPEWIELFAPESAEALALHRSDPANIEKPPPVGTILVSFELRPEQDAKKERQKQQLAEMQARLVELEGDLEGGKSPAAKSPGKSALSRWRPPQPEFLLSARNPIPNMPLMVPCFVEVALVGVRDMQPRIVAGLAVEISSPYVEFEYGHRNAPERFWKTNTTEAKESESGSGPNANFLELKYMQVMLPDEPRYDPVMGVRVRDTAKLLALVDSEMLANQLDPIVGVCNVPLKEKMPSYERYEAERIAREEEEEEVRRLERLEEDERKLAEGTRVDVTIPEWTNEEILEELVFESTAKAKGDTTVFKKGGKRSEPAGSRSISAPETTDLDNSDDSSTDSEEEEGEEGDAVKDPILTVPLESTLKDIPFEAHKLHLGANKPTVRLGKLEYGKKRQSGILKMSVRIFEEAGFEQKFKESPPVKLKQMFREQICKARVHVYWCTNLTARADGKPPAPFLKVSNGTKSHQIKSTVNRPVGNSLNPEFYTSFELTAVLPGQSQLHVEVWDYTLLREILIGGTTIDLEDRMFSPQWQEMSRIGKLPRELRQLFTTASTMPQGNVILRVEILPLQFAKMNPMAALAPPAKKQFQLRLVVWEAKDVAMKDSGQSDVFVTIKPRGESDYERQSTDTHWFSTGDAEFNWRMIWEVFLPEKVPRLFIQVWDQDIIGADDAIGEAELNLKSMYEKVLKKNVKQKQERMWVPCTHPNFKGVQARVCMTIEVLNMQEAILFPAGRARDAPNENPHLENPVRPGLFDGLGLSFAFFNPFGMFKRYFKICCCCICVVAIVAVAVFLSTQSG